MGISLSFFDSAVDLDKYLDQQLADAKALLVSHGRRIEEARRNFEGPRAGEKAKEKKKDPNSSKKGGAKQMDLDNFKLLANPSPEYEMNLLDEAILTIQDKISSLEKAKRQIVPRLKDTYNIVAIFDDGIPTAFMYHDQLKSG